MNAKANTTDVTILDMDAMLDMKMDEVETLPDFVNPPAGNYRLACKGAKIEKYKSKKEPTVEKTRIRTTYAVVETKEVAAGSVPVADGTLFTETFMGTEEGLKYFKKTAMGILNVTDFEGATMKDVIDGLADQEFDARITVRVTKDEAGATFENLSIKPFHSPAD